MVQRNQPGHKLHRTFIDSIMMRFYNNASKGRRTNLSSGNPAFEPFRPAITAAQEEMENFRIRIYGNPGSNAVVCKALLPYCEDNGLTPNNGGLNQKNILTGMGITHLYACTIEALAKKATVENPGKTPVLLMTSPTYGLFATQPEPFGFDIETVPLREEENWQTNADLMNNRIQEINASGDRFVSAFYRVNPHNPLGTVEGHATTEQIARVLRKHNVFGIDDLAYLGQENRGEVVPLAHFDFDNNVTLMGISKTFCMPGLRGGFMCGPKDMISAASEAALRTTQSTSITTDAALAASFGEKYAEEREQYIAANKQGYLQRFDVLKALINGIDSIPEVDGTRVQEIEDLAKQVFANKQDTEDVLNNGVEGIEIVNGNMDAGYFAVLKVQDHESLYYGTDKLRDSFHISAACIDQGRVLTLPMASALAGDNLAGAVRVTFGLTEKNIVKGVKGLYQAMHALTEKPDPILQDKLAKNGLLLNCEIE